MNYRNLEAEQARKGWTDEKTASYLNISRSTYIGKKRAGSFKVEESKALCMAFGVPFEYLFANGDSKSTA